MGCQHQRFSSALSGLFPPALFPSFFPPLPALPFSSAFSPRVPQGELPQRESVLPASISDLGSQAKRTSWVESSLGPYRTPNFNNLLKRRYPFFHTFSPAQWALRGTLMPRGKNCREAIFAAQLPQKYPHHEVILQAISEAKK